MFCWRRIRYVLAESRILQSEVPQRCLSAAPRSCQQICMLTFLRASVLHSLHGLTNWFNFPSQVNRIMLKRMVFRMPAVWPPTVDLLESSMLQLHSSPVQKENHASAHVLFSFVMAHMVFAFTVAGQCSGRERDNVSSPRANGTEVAAVDSLCKHGS